MRMNNIINKSIYYYNLKILNPIYYISLNQFYIILFIFHLFKLSLFQNQVEIFSNLTLFLLKIIH